MSSTPQQDDIRLVQAAQRGDAQAFGDLYERHARAVFRFLYAHIQNRQDAEDLTEEVFLKVWRALPGYREQGIPFQAYLFRIARHALIDLYRKSGRGHQQVSTEDIPLHDENPGPAEAFLNMMEQERLRTALGRLTEDYQTVLVLRYLMDFSAEETAQVMSRSAGAIRVLQHRALSALRMAMREQ